MGGGKKEDKDVKILSKDRAKKLLGDVHKFKEECVGKKNISRFDLYRHNKTGEIILKSKDGKISVPTGHFIQ